MERLALRPAQTTVRAQRLQHDRPGLLAAAQQPLLAECGAVVSIPDVTAAGFGGFNEAGFPKNQYVRPTSSEQRHIRQRVLAQLADGRTAHLQDHLLLDRRGRRMTCIHQSETDETAPAYRSERLDDANRYRHPRLPHVGYGMPGIPKASRARTALSPASVCWAASLSANACSRSATA